MSEHNPDRSPSTRGYGAASCRPAVEDARAAVTRPDPQKPNTPLRDLLRVVAAAVRHDQPWLVQSIFGRISTWPPPFGRYSERAALNHRDPLGTLRYLIAVTVPSFSRAPGRIARTVVPPFAQRLFWRSSFYYRQPDPFGSVTSFPDERWFFLNGVATDPKLARMNTRLLSEMFGRPITGVYNATNSLLLDLIECAVAKRYKITPDLDDPTTLTTPGYMSARAILHAVKDPDAKRVVVIAHSQGTIVAANVIRAIATALDVSEATRKAEPIEANLDLIEQESCDCLVPPHPERMSQGENRAHFARLVGKLEFYLFANCADRMNFVLTADASGASGRHNAKTNLPYLENFANEHDLIARLGVLSPLRETAPEIISIDGPLYLRKGEDAWGHFLNAHHLQGIKEHLEDPENVPNPYQPVAQDQPAIPRLYRYFGASRP